MSESLESLLEQIHRDNRIAAVDLETVRYNVRPAHENAIARATTGLAQLIPAYREKVLQGATALFLLGDQGSVDKFTTIAAEIPHLFVVNADAYYQHLTGRVEEIMTASRQFAIQQLTALILAIRRIAKDIGAREPAMPRPPDLRTCPTAADLTDYVRQLVQGTDGNIAPNYLAFNLGTLALARESRVPITVLVTNLTQPDWTAFGALFSNDQRTVTVTPEDVIDETFVISVVVQRGQDRKSEGKKPASVTTKTDKHGSKRT